MSLFLCMVWGCVLTTLIYISSPVFPTPFAEETTISILYILDYFDEDKLTVSESRSVVSDSLWPHGLYNGILQVRILDWEAIPFSKGSSQLRDQTQVSCITGRLFTIWATREASIDCRCVDLFLGSVILFHWFTYVFFLFLFFCLCMLFWLWKFYSFVWSLGRLCLLLSPFPSGLLW